MYINMHIIMIIFYIMALYMPILYSPCISILFLFIIFRHPNYSVCIIPSTKLCGTGEGIGRYVEIDDGTALDDEQPVRDRFDINTC